MNRRKLLTSAGSIIFTTGCLRGQTDDSDEANNQSENPAGTEDGSGDRAGVNERLEVDWPQYGYNARNTAYIPEPAGPIESTRLNQIWSELGDSLILVDNQLYADGEVYNIKTGEKSDIVGRGDHTIVHDGILFISGSGEDGSKGRIAAFEMTGSSFNGLWEKTLEPVDDNRSFPMGSPALANETFYQVTGDGTLHAINIATGDTRWKYNLGSQKEQVPAIQDGLIYISGSGETAALSRAGDVNWTQSYDFTSSPVVKDEDLYFFGDTGYDTDQGVYALDINDGSVQWSRDIGSLSYEGTRNLAVDTDTVYANTDTAIYAFNRSNGKKKWQTQFDGSGEICVSENHVFAVGKDSSAGAIIALTKDTGEKRWKEIVTSPIMTEPIISGTKLYFGAGDGTYVIRGS